MLKLIYRFKSAKGMLIVAMEIADGMGLEPAEIFAESGEKLKFNMADVMLMRDEVITVEQYIERNKL